MKINPNITVQSLEYSALDCWVEARCAQQTLEKQAKSAKKKADGLFQDAQLEALQKLADINGLVDVEPDVYPLMLSKAKKKTFEYNPLFKVQVSFTNQVVEDEELKVKTELLKNEKEALELANKAEIDVLLAEKALLDTKIAALRNNDKISKLETEIAELRERLTLPVVKSLALKAI